jgi:hypothetical protein
MPENIGEFTLPLGVPETLRAGSDVTVVTYGACCEIALRAAALLESIGISIEIIDVQTLLPFDLNSSILESIKKTNRVLFLDEDCPAARQPTCCRKLSNGRAGSSGWMLPRERFQQSLTARHTVPTAITSPSPIGSRSWRRCMK